MDKQLSSKDGFTIMEMLFVLMMYAMLCLVFVRIDSDSYVLYQTLLQLKSFCDEAQFLAMKEGVRKQISFAYNQAIINEQVIPYPKQMTCIPFTFSYNAMGNISKAGSVTCSLHNEQHKIVFQLGSGRSDVR